jgi:hypothetical protein
MRGVFFDSAATNAQQDQNKAYSPPVYFQQEAQVGKSAGTPQ